MMEGTMHAVLPSQTGPLVESRRVLRALQRQSGVARCGLGLHVDVQFRGSSLRALA
jgi:hypothetical protein